MKIRFMLGASGCLLLLLSSAAVAQEPTALRDALLFHVRHLMEPPTPISRRATCGSTWRSL